jgi:hypothetical protein
VPKFSGYKPGVFYDTAEPQRTALLTAGRQSGRDGYFDLLLVAGEAHDQVRPTTRVRGGCVRDVLVDSASADGRAGERSALARAR